MLINPLLDMAAEVVELVVMVTICSVVLSMLLLPLAVLLVPLSLSSFMWAFFDSLAVSVCVWSKANPF